MEKQEYFSEKAMRHYPPAHVLARMYAHAIEEMLARHKMIWQLTPRGIRRTKFHQVRRGPRHMTFPIRLADSDKLDAALKLGPKIGVEVKSPHVIAMTNRAHPGFVLVQIELPEPYWMWFNRGHMPTPLSIGIGEDGYPIEFTWDPPHTLVAGTTGAGKSVLMESALVGLCNAYTPDQLQIVLIDPSGEFERLAGVEHLVFREPIRDPRDIDRAIIWTGQRWQERHRANNREAPHLVLVMDETDNVVSGRSERLQVMEIIARDGRKFNVTLFMGTQRPTVSKMQDAAALANNRFVGMVHSASEAVAATGLPGTMAQFLSGKGDFLKIGRGADWLTRFQTAMTHPHHVSRLPRGGEFEDLEMLDTDYSALLDSAGFDLPGKPGRQEIVADGTTMAWYVWHGLQDGWASLSRRYCQSAAGFTRKQHEANKPEAIALVDELRRLAQSHGGRTVLELGE